MKYFDIHLFYDRKNGCSVPVAISDEKIENSFNFEDDVIENAIEQKLIDAEDQRYIDYVNEIDENEYKQMKGM